jgi:flagellar biosynthesis/type III secretory pathway protein FliH
MKTREEIRLALYSKMWSDQALLDLFEQIQQEAFDEGFNKGFDRGFDETHIASEADSEVEC